MTVPVSVDVPRAARLELIDYLRFIAAASVVLYHYFAKGIETGKITGIDHTTFVAVAKYGYLGVPLFFLISGFVIFRSAQGRSARAFAVGRAVRLYPAFWVAVLATSGVVAMWGSEASVSPTQVVGNLTMAPGIFNVALVDGVYWTLLLELYFYLAIFVLLLVGQGRRLGALIPWWVVGQFAVLILAPHLSSVTFLGNSFVLFSLGALISEIFSRGLTPVRAAAFVLGVYLACDWSIRGVVPQTAPALGYSNPVLVAVTLACVLMLMVAASKRVRGLRLPMSRPLGAMTYPLYLIHASIGYIALSRLAKVVPIWLDYTIVIAGALSLAYLLHVAVERRQNAFWFRFFDATVGRAVDAVRWPIQVSPRRLRSGKRQDAEIAEQGSR